MTQQKALWNMAKKQAAQVPKIKDRKAKNRQIVLLCKTLKKAMGASDA